jgi:hypothetical protein
MTVMAGVNFGLLEASIFLVVLNCVIDMEKGLV